VTKNAPQMAIIQLGVAFKNFFSGRARYPRFRKKGACDRFTLTTTISSTSTVAASAYRNLAGCGCAKRCVSLVTSSSATISRVRLRTGNTIDGRDRPRSQGTYHASSEVAPSLTRIKPKAAKIPQPREGQAEASPATCPDCQYPHGRASQADHGFGAYVELKGVDAAGLVK